MRFNVSVVGHSGVGKTSLVEAMLYRAGQIKRLGAVMQKNTHSDHTALEQEHQMSIFTSVLPFNWHESQVTLLDTPGFADFVGEIRGALRSADNTLVVVSAVSGVEVGTERVWKTADEFGMPRIIAVNKMDRDRADFFEVLSGLEASISGPVVATHLPIGKEKDFSGVIDLLSRKAYIGEQVVDIPAGYEDQVQEYRAKLVERIVETDEELIERYLADEEVTLQELNKALLTAFKTGQIDPVVPVSATTLIGVDALLDLLVTIEREAAERPAFVAVDGQTRPPTPDAPFSARVFRSSTDPFLGKVAYVRVWSGTLKPGQPIYNASRGTTSTPAHLYTLNGKDLQEVPELTAGMIGALTKISDVKTGETLCDPHHLIDYGPLHLPDPVVSMALHPKTRQDEDKLTTQMGRLLDDDPTLTFARNSETGEWVLSGLGDMHLNLAIEELALLGVQVTTSKPKIPYRETIKTTAKSQGKYKKQTGGHGQYGDCWLRLEPSGENFEFASEVVGGVVPSKYIPSIHKGVEESLSKGALAGYPVQNIKVVVYDGSYHEVDSSDIAFKMAAGLAFREAMSKAQPILMEPILQLNVYIPGTSMGDVLADLQGKRAQILGMDTDGNLTVVRALVPQSELQEYSAQLRSITGGRGAYSLKFSNYAEVPQHLQGRIIQARQSEQHA
ncbi:elongation factor G [Deinococcus roseus]|uniref:Elongation factor G n=1 Tax=Deinococcus roseus TaxID=392414 RepID=A0ABQ2DEP9_9DEIO|nr:elongation factor G [Deinococcus roseus]GGJ55054.1 elongation factor G [Deinococcus roseus]